LHFCVEHDAAVSFTVADGKPELLSFLNVVLFTDVEFPESQVSLPGTSETGPIASRTTHHPAIHATTRYVIVVTRIETNVPFGIALWASRRSPEMFAPARIPVAAGKKMANTEKNVCPSRKPGTKLAPNVCTETDAQSEWCRISCRKLQKLFKHIFTTKYSQEHTKKTTEQPSKGKSHITILQYL